MTSCEVASPARRATSLTPQWCEILPPARGRGTGRPRPARAGVARQLATTASPTTSTPTRTACNAPGRSTCSRSSSRAPNGPGSEAGVLQRARLLNDILRDLYGPQRLLAEDGLLPPALVQGHPGLPARHAWRAAAGRDLAAPGRGRSRPRPRRPLVGGVAPHPVALRSRLPAENRITIGRQFPAAFNSLHIQRLGASYRR